MSKICLNCHSENPDNASACAKCGFRLSVSGNYMICSYCHSSVQAGSQNCPNCGRPLYSNPNNLANINYQNQGYQNQGYQNQGYQNQGYQNQGYQNQGYQNQGYQNQGYQNQGYQNQGYQNQGYQNQGYQNQGYQNQGYQNQGYQNQGYQNQGYQNQRYQNQGYGKYYLNDSGTGAGAVLPIELRGLNWGAFFIFFWWSIFNRSYVGLLTLIFPFMAFVLLVKGNEWAWQNRRFESVEEFKAVQKAWAAWGVTFFIIGLIATFIFYIAFFALMYSSY